jgi:hypothetical protein
MISLEINRNLGALNSAPQHLNLAKKFLSHSHKQNATMPSTHNAEKPWDTDDIDKWKVRAE